MLQSTATRKTHYPQHSFTPLESFQQFINFAVARTFITTDMDNCSL